MVDTQAARALCEGHAMASVDASLGFTREIEYLGELMGCSSNAMTIRAMRVQRRPYGRPSNRVGS